MELRWKRRGGLIFEGGVLAGHYGIHCNVRGTVHNVSDYYCTIVGHVQVLNPVFQLVHTWLNTLI